MPDKRLSVELEVTQQGVEVFDKAGNKLAKLEGQAKRTGQAMFSMDKSIAGIKSRLQTQAKAQDEANTAMIRGSAAAARAGQTIFMATQQIQAMTGASHPLVGQIAALTGTGATAITTFADLSANAKGLGAVFKSMGGKMSGVAKSMKGVNVGMVGLVASAAAAGVALNRIIKLSGELAEVNAEAANAQAKSAQMTERQAMQYQAMLIQLGISAAEAKKLNLTLLDMIQIAKQSPGGRIAAGIKEISVAAPVASAALSALQAEIKKQAKAATESRNRVKETTENLLEQAGVMDQMHFEEQLQAMANAWEVVKQQTGDSSTSAKLFGDELNKLTAMGKDLGLTLPQAFQDTAAGAHVAADAAKVAKAALDETAIAVKKLVMAQQAGKMSAQAFGQAMVSASMAGREAMLLAKREASDFKRELDYISSASSTIELGQGGKGTAGIFDEGPGEVSVSKEQESRMLERLKSKLGDLKETGFFQSFITSFAREIKGGSADIGKLEDILQATVTQGMGIQKMQHFGKGWGGAQNELRGMAQILGQMLQELKNNRPTGDLRDILGRFEDDVERGETRRR